MNIKVWWMVALFLFIPCFYFAETTGGNTVYQNELFGFRLEVPSNWTMAFEGKKRYPIT